MNKPKQSFFPVNSRIIFLAVSIAMVTGSLLSTAIYLKMRHMERDNILYHQKMGRTMTPADFPVPAWLYLAAGIMLTGSLSFHLHRVLLQRRSLEIIVSQRGEDLREREELFRTLCATVPVGIFRTDISGFTYVNEDFEKITGLRGPKALGLEYFRIIHPDDAERIWQVYTDIRTESVREHRILVEGAVRWVQVRGKPVFTALGAVRERIGTLEDITELKQREAELKAYQEKLRSLTLQMSLVSEQERRGFAAFLHDNIGQALVATKMKADMLQAAAAGEEVPAIQDIAAAIEYCIDLSRSLTYELSVPVLYEAGFEAAIEWLVESMKHDFGVKFSVFSDRSGDLLSLDTRIILFRVVRELCMNVVKHADVCEGRITIGAEGDRIAVSVADKGKGFDPAQYEKVGHASFGLFSINEQVRMLGGTFTVNASRSHGTKATVTLPLQGYSRNTNGQEGISHDKDLAC